MEMRFAEAVPGHSANKRKCIKTSNFGRLISRLFIHDCEFLENHIVGNHIPHSYELEFSFYFFMRCFHYELTGY